jgi:hypothetical protein
MFVVRGKERKQQQQQQHKTTKKPIIILPNQGIHNTANKQWQTDRQGWVQP